MDLNQLFGIFNNRQIIAVAFKTLAIFSGAFYLIYAIVISKQTQVMSKTLQAKHNNIFSFISSLQITAGIILLILAILLV